MILCTWYQSRGCGPPPAEARTISIYKQGNLGISRKMHNRSSLLTCCTNFDRHLKMCGRLVKPVRYECYLHVSYLLPVFRGRYLCKRMLNFRRECSGLYLVSDCLWRGKFNPGFDLRWYSYGGEVAAYACVGSFRMYLLRTLLIIYCSLF